MLNISYRRVCTNGVHSNVAEPEGETRPRLEQRDAVCEDVEMEDVVDEPMFDRPLERHVPKRGRENGWEERPWKASRVTRDDPLLKGVQAPQMFYRRI